MLLALSGFLECLRHADQLRLGQGLRTLVPAEHRSSAPEPQLGYMEANYSWEMRYTMQAPCHRATAGNRSNRR